jgi:glucan biosynthesis protein C
MAMSTPIPLSSDRERLHGLDALRGIALLLGLVVHGSMAFLPGAQYFWVVHDPEPSPWLGLAFYIPHMFRMLLFFVLAGFFGRLLLNRLGTVGFLKDRGKRITLVLLAAWPIVMSGIVAVIVVGGVLVDPGAAPASAPPGPAFTPDDFPLTHLWFLYVLTFCYSAMLALRAALRRLDRGEILTRAADASMRVLGAPVGPFLLAIPLALALFHSEGWYHWFGIPTPDRTLYANVPAWVAFGSAFVFGWWLHRQPALLERWARQWPLHLVLAIGATIACLVQVGLNSPAVPAPADATTLGYALVYALGGWSWTFALIGLSMRFMAGHSPARRTLADASYWIYLAHIPVVMALQLVASRMPGPAPLKFVLVVGFTLGLLLLAYRSFVRRTWIGVWLNGRRRP